MQIVNTVMGDLGMIFHNVDAINTKLYPACHYAFGRHKADIVRTGGNVVLALKVRDVFTQSITLS